jgi:hypothetical protein
MAAEPSGSVPARRRRATVLSATCLLVLAGCGLDPGPAPGGTAPGSAPAAAAAPVTAPSATSTGHGTVATTKVPLYWVGTADGEQRLFREFRDTAEGPAAVDPIAAAAALLTTSAPEDPDHRTYWSPVDQVGSSTSPDGTITVDLPSGAFRSRLGEGEARLALQQLAHTVTATASTAGLLPQSSRPEVVVLVDGRARQEVFGSVRLDRPLRPDEGLEAPLWLVDPRAGAHPDGAVTLSGRALEGVGECRWTVTDEDGATVSSGALPTVPQGDGTVGFRTELELSPGTYEVRVTGRTAEDEPVHDGSSVEVVPR